MRFIQIGAMALMTALLAACGGGGGGGGAGGGDGAVGPVVPPSPPPKNISDLTVNEQFAGPAATSDSVFDLTAGTVVSSSGAPSTISVTYDAAAKSYTVTLPNRSQTFAASDRVNSNIPGETVYQKTGAADIDSLALVTTEYSSGRKHLYVGLGYWQQADVEGDRQNDRFATFVYGFDTPLAGVPRQGRATFGIDVFGASTVPGYEPSVFQGEGTFEIDFMAGVFSTHTYLTEFELLSGDSLMGGGLELTGAGLMSSGDAAFSGNVTVEGVNAQLAGTLTGQFYGPNAQEVGASFSASNALGAVAAGSFTGQRIEGPTANLTLGNLVVPQIFYAQGSLLWLHTTDGESGADVRGSFMGGSLRYGEGDGFIFAPGSSGLPQGEFTAASIVASDDPNFTVYEETFNLEPFGDRDVRLELYKIGQANSELALTYVSLGRWEGSERGGVNTRRNYHHFTYGLETPGGLLAARTGSARYDGVVYGAAGNKTTGAHHDVRGTSRFDVDFSRHAFSGALVLNGGDIDFGTYDFAGSLGNFAVKDNVATITHGGTDVGQIITRFYGPTGEEMGGSFDLWVPEGVHPGGTVVTGATVARRQ